MLLFHRFICFALFNIALNRWAWLGWSHSRPYSLGTYTCLLCPGWDTTTRQSWWIQCRHTHHTHTHTHTHRVCVETVRLGISSRPQHDFMLHATWMPMHDCLILCSLNLVVYRSLRVKPLVIGYSLQSFLSDAIPHRNCFNSPVQGRHCTFEKRTCMIGHFLTDDERPSVWLKFERFLSSSGSAVCTTFILVHMSCILLTVCNWVRMGVSGLQLPWSIEKKLSLIGCWLFLNGHRCGLLELDWIKAIHLLTGTRHF